MKIAEYEKVKDLTYLQYCDYLQNKYGFAKGSYYTRNGNKNSHLTRTKEGLVIHHKYEDHAILLADPEFAKKNPYEWQSAENLVYCDYLEHLLLHILICRYPAEDKNPNEEVGIGGIVNYIVPELNDVYSGYVTSQEWRANCHEAIIRDKDVYLKMIKEIDPYLSATGRSIDLLKTSYNEKFLLWSNNKNVKLFKEFDKL